ncbi:hypothetical protein Val02_53170 [Virgisporangium aliadipatigenens]|uniref:Fibronectin type-III domain-containing protein n=2 Tax=Virgisporangium aliadipatigenens TaxID=741659 RepID=A0A8J4DSR4_9ACTN|nr:hypothetical protein Val02_53170 [Virgisporangium aliadipatigenens]
MTLAVCLAAVTAAVSGAASRPPALGYTNSGHWVAVPGLGVVYHVNGAGRAVDAQADVGEVEPGSQVVQSDTSGYVVGPSRITEFGKSDLAVDQTLKPPTGERPVALETASGPYLVYREAGSVVRLGDKATTIPAGGPLGEPVATPDGSVWLHRLDANSLCRLAPAAERITCPALVPNGHTGALTVVGERPVFLDTDADSLSPVDPDGLGQPTKIGVDVPRAARVAPVDVRGRVAIVDPAAKRMHLVDGTDLGRGRQPAPPVTVNLPDGTYSAPVAGGSSVVLIDTDNRKVLTYNADGQQQHVADVPEDVGEPRLRRGDDKRVYVDGPEGTRVLVVDEDGSVANVPVVGTGPSASAPPVSPSAEPSAGARPGGSGPPTGSPAPIPSAPPRSPGTPTTTQGPRAAPASPPGMPPGLTATPEGDTLRVAWGAAPANGAAVTDYLVSWAPVAGGAGGNSGHGGSARATTITGLTRGVAYQITVVARNSAGRGTPAQTRATLPAATRTATVTRGRPTTYEDSCGPPNCHFMHIELRGFAPNTSYHVDPHSSEKFDYNPGATLRTDSQGVLIFERFPFSSPGETIWVTVRDTDVESNRYVWPAA